MTTGQAIKKARKAKGYTQLDIARKLGVHQITVSLWETDRNSPCLIFLISLADVLGISLDELVGRSNR